MNDRSGPEITREMLDFIHGCPTSAHAAAQASGLLEKAGFLRLNEGDSWDIHPGLKGYVVRGSSSLAAFRIGTLPPEEVGFRAIGAHADSPCLRLKPHALYKNEGYLMLGVEVYGGALLASWTDRDLSIAGRMLIEKDGQKEVVLVDVKRPVCRVPQVAIHLNREVNDKGLLLDKQKHMPPILGLADENFDKASLQALLAEAADVDEDAIIDFTLDLYDTQLPCIGGINNEFYFSPRIDNLAGCFGAIQALVHAPEQDRTTSVIALFDNEEIGSRSHVGAESTLLDAVFERICLKSPQPRENLLRALSRTVLVSSDGAHAVHPNYADMHDNHHRPLLNGGPVIKVHAGLKYATTAETKAHFIDCARRAQVPFQIYANRSDLKSGSTIGPISSTRLGVSTVDVGVPMLSMHSIREMGGVEDIRLMILALAQHFTTGA